MSKIQGIGPYLNSNQNDGLNICRDIDKYIEFDLSNELRMT